MADLTESRVIDLIRQTMRREGIDLLAGAAEHAEHQARLRRIFAPVERVDLIGALHDVLPALERHAPRTADGVRDLLEREAVERLREVAPIADTTGMEGRLAEALRRRVQACRCDGSDPACAADRALLAERAAKAAPDYDGECCALCKCNHGSPIRTLTEEHCICRDDGHRWVSRKVAAPPAALTDEATGREVFAEVLDVLAAEEVACCDEDAKVVRGIRSQLASRPLLAELAREAAPPAGETPGGEG